MKKYRKGKESPLNQGNTQEKMGSNRENGRNEGVNEVKETRGRVKKTDEVEK